MQLRHAHVSVRGVTGAIAACSEGRRTVFDGEQVWHQVHSSHLLKALQLCGAPLRQAALVYCLPHRRILAEHLDVLLKASA